MTNSNDESTMRYQFAAIRGYLYDEIPMEDYPKIYLYRRVVQAKLYIDSKFAEAIDLENIGGEPSYSRFHFLRLFKKAYGHTRHQYLTRIRIEQAKRLLDKNLPVTDVCFSVGFDSIS